MITSRKVKRITTGIMAWFCVLSSQALVECGLYADGGGANIFLGADNIKTGEIATTYRLTKEADVLNNAKFTFEVACDANVSDAELNEVIMLSGVKKKPENGETPVAPTATELRNATDASSAVRITDVGSFFKTDANKCKLANFEISRGWGSGSLGTELAKINITNELKTRIKTIEDNYSKRKSELEQAISNCEFGSDEYNEAYSNEWSYDTTDAWNQITDDDFNKLSALANTAIEVARKCYAFNNNSTVGTHLTNAETGYNGYQNSSNNQDKFKYLLVAIGNAFMACCVSIENRATELGITEDFTAGCSDYYYLKNSIYNSYNYVDDTFYWPITNLKGFYLPGMTYMLERATVLELLKGGVDGLTLDVTETVGAEASTSVVGETFQIYDTEARHAKLYFKNNVITFEIPLDLPERTSDAENPKINSFTISCLEKNAILSESK